MIELVRIFVSYSRDDADNVRPIISALESDGHDVWVDIDDVRGSERWRVAIAEAIDQADAIVLMISPRSMASTNVEREVTVASEEEKRIVPVVIRDAKIPVSLQYELAGIQRVSFVDQPFDRAMTDLRVALGHPTRGDRTTEDGARPTRLGRPRFSVRTVVATISVVLVLIVLGLLAWWGTRGASDTTEVAETDGVTETTGVTETAPVTGATGVTETTRTTETTASETTPTDTSEVSDTTGAPLVGCPETPSVVFCDDFDGAVLDSARWSLFDNDGTVTLVGGEVVLRSDATSFPLLVAKDPLPDSGQFRVIVSFRFTEAGTWGTGFRAQAGIPENGRSTDPVGEPVIAKVWQDIASGWVIESECGSIGAPTDIGPHTAVFEFDERGQVRVWLDEQEVDTCPGLGRADELWLGNPTAPAEEGGDWTSVSFDLVRVDSEW